MQLRFPEKASIFLISFFPSRIACFLPPPDWDETTFLQCRFGTAQKKRHLLLLFWLRPPLSSSSSSGGQLYGTNSPANGHSRKNKKNFSFSLFSSAVYHGQTETPAAKRGGRLSTHKQGTTSFLAEKRGKKTPNGLDKQERNYFQDTLSAIAKQYTAHTYLFGWKIFL